MTSTWLKVRITQEKKFSNTNPCKLFTNFTILISRFCLVVRVAPISLFFIFLFYIIIYSIFTICDSFSQHFSLNDATNFITYVLQIGMSPITKNNFKHLFIIFFK